MRRALVVCAGVLGVLLLGSAARADIHAVAKPATQSYGEGCRTQGPDSG